MEQIRNGAPEQYRRFHSADGQRLSDVIDRDKPCVAAGLRGHLEIVFVDGPAGAVGLDQIDQHTVRRPDCRDQAFAGTDRFLPERTLQRLCPTECPLSIVDPQAESANGWPVQLKMVGSGAVRLAVQQ